MGSSFARSLALVLPLSLEGNKNKLEGGSSLKGAKESAYPEVVVAARAAAEAKEPLLVARVCGVRDLTRRGGKGRGGRGENKVRWWWWASVKAWRQQQTQQRALLH